MIRVNLIGGIGNQLFQYYAGLYLAQGKSERLTVNSRFSQFGRTGHDTLIKDLGLPGRFTFAKSDKKSALAANLFSRRVESFFGRLAAQRRPLIPILGTYVSPVVGFDPTLEQDLRGIRRLSIWGFFQSWKYANDLENAGHFPKPDIVNPSPWFESQMARQTGRKVLTIHIRRGDYRSLGETLGMLDQMYYLEALRTLKALGAEWDEAWIFTDDVECLTKEMPDFLEQGEFKVASPTPTSHPGESLLAIANADYIIIANSTFSWWSAFLSTRCALVVRPEKWFKGKPDPDFLFPDIWVPAPSHWSQNV